MQQNLAKLEATGSAVSPWSRVELATQMLQRLQDKKAELERQYHAGHRVSSFVVDDLLDPAIALSIYEAFPPKESMRVKKSLREYKYIAAQMNQYHPLLEEIVFAFQDPRVVSLISEIVKCSTLLPDEHLYAGGISLMGQGNFLNPHLDNSHDKDKQNYRAFNLLYYVTPDWQEEFGGNLELWDDGPTGKQRTIVSRFNRLAVMVTHRDSWHSVSPIRVDQTRCCVSNYYFSSTPMEEEPYAHVTSFRGRPEQRLRDVVLQGDNALRNLVGRMLKRNIALSHYYKK